MFIRSSFTVRRVSLQEASPFDGHYGLELGEASADLVRARVAVRDHLKQPTGVVHGGVYASIAEALASYGTTLGVLENGMVGLGMSNHSSFLRPISGGTIHAEARPRHRGRTTWIWDVDLSDDEGRVCAVSRVTIAVRPLDRRAPV
jgi:1,4-dihydroxy-2-naphthoyl-CoA hydrolase